MTRDAGELLRWSALSEQALEDGDVRRAAAIDWVLREAKWPWRIARWWTWHSELETRGIPAHCILPPSIYQLLFQRWAPKQAGTHLAGFESEEAAYEALLAVWTGGE